MPDAWGTVRNQISKGKGSGFWNLSGGPGFPTNRAICCNKTEDRGHGDLDGPAKLSTWEKQIAQQNLGVGSHVGKKSTQ